MRTWASILETMGALRRDDDSAKHKPILLLWALARVLAGSPNAFRFSEVKAGTAAAMSRWAPRSTIFYPFWHLQSDDLWIIDGAHELPRRPGESRPLERALQEADSEAHFPEDVWIRLMEEDGRPAVAFEHVLKTYWNEEDWHAAQNDSSLRLGRAISASAFPDQVHIREVEAAAVAAVWRFLEKLKFKIDDRQKDNCGYDLHCVSKLDAIHVEVKGTSGPEARFFLSRNEHRSFEDDPRWRLGMVTNALTLPSVCLMTAAEVRASFEFTPDGWIAEPRPR